VVRKIPRQQAMAALSEFFFENFAPPLPENDVRDGKHPKKKSKIIIDFISIYGDNPHPYI